MSEINQRIAKLSPAQRALLEKKLQEKAAKSNQKQSIPQRSDGNPAPLSFSQERMWILDQFEPGNPAYNRPSNIHLVGVLNVLALAQSLNEIVRRHEILRTSFPVVDGQAIQAIAPTLTISLPLVDLSHLPTSERDAEVQRLAIQAAQHKFNLSQLPLIQATLLRLSEEEHILLLTLHHIIFDGWSMGVLLKELAAFYDVFVNAKSSSLPVLPIQYADFASWQKERLQGEKLETQLAYWKKQLGGDISVLKLPTDRSRSHSRTFRGGKEVQRLPKNLSESLKALSQQEGVTLFMTLLAAFQTLLYGYTGQEDITVGTPIAGRDRTEIENSIGLFINTLVLRTSVEGNSTFRELLKRVREVALAAETHREIPFDKLVEELKPKRNLHQPPFFQVLFQLRNLPKESIEVAGIKMEDYPLETGMVMVDLSLELEEQPEGLLAVFKYDTDLFKPETIASIGLDFQSLLRDIVANLDRPIAELTDHLLAKHQTQNESFSCYLIGHQSLVIPCAQHLLEKGHQIFGIISTGASIDRWTSDQNIPLLQEKDDLVDVLSQRPFDYLFSIYNLSILPEKLFKLPRRYAINCHDSLLPQYGGINAPSWAILNQEKVHGVTWHQIDHLIDSGDIIKQVTIEIDPNETAFTLIGKCYQAALESFVELIDDLQHDAITLIPQNLENRSYFSISQKPSPGCLLPWYRQGEELKIWMRALDFGNYQNLLGLPKLAIANTFIIISQLEVLETASSAVPGTITAIESDRLIVSTGSHNVALTQMLTLEGKTLSIPELVTRFRLQIGDCCEEIESTQIQHLKEIETAIAKHESFWVEKLATLQPIASPDRNWLYGNQDIFSPLPGEDMASKNWLVFPEIGRFLASHSEGWNLEEFLVAAFAAYLARIIETDDFDLGWRLTTSKRPDGGLKNFFAVDVPFRLKINLKQGIGEVVKAVQQQMQSVERRRTYPRDILLRHPELQELRKLGFQHQFPVTIERVETLDRTSNLSTYGLTFVIPKTGEQCRWVYDTAAFDRESFDRFSNSFTTFVRHLVIDSDRSLAELPLISDRECDRILQQWNSPSTNAFTNLGIHQLFEQQVLQSPNAIAVQFENQQITYGELNVRANQLAHYLQEFGIQPEQLVGICVERSIEMLVGILGILKAGGAYLPLDPTYPTERLEYIISDAQISLLLTQEKLLDRFSNKGLEQVCLDRDWHKITLANRENPNRPVSPDNLAYTIYTSGSTGQPKGVIIEHQSLVNFAQAAIAQYGIERSDRVLQFASISFDAAAEEIYPCLLSGGTLVLRTDEMLSSIETFLKRCQEWKITVLDLPTAYWQQMLRELVAAKYNLPTSLRLVIIGGERALPQSIKLWQQWVGDFPQLLNTYGPTESTVVATVYQVSTSTPILQEVPIGRAIANVQTYILDRNLQPVSIGMPGELYLGGAGLARGYLNRPELTAEKFIPHPFSQEPNARLYKTGDRVRYLKDGNIEFLGRIDNQVKIRGFRIELGEIETILLQHPGVKEAVVVVQEERDNKHLVAYFVGNGKQPILTELRSFLKTKLPDYMMPSNFISLDALPLTPSGKIDRLALPKPDRARQESTDIIKTSKDELELQLIQIWKEVLNLKSIQTSDNFFDLGGHSLLAIKLFSQIKNRLGQDIPVATLFQAQTIEELAKILRLEGWSNRWVTLVPIKPDGSQAPFFFHGGAADATTWVKFAHLLPRDRPFYGLQHPILDGKPFTQNSLAEMAANCVKEIRTIQPNGPYFIGGHCFGGVVAFEIAQQLRAQGEEIALLALIDAFAPKPLPQNNLLWKTQAVFHKVSFLLQKTYYYHADDLKQRNGWEKFKYVTGWLKKKFQPKLQQRLNRTQLPSKKSSYENNSLTDNNLHLQKSNKSINHELRYQEAEKANRAAKARYTPQVYPGAITLFRAKTQLLEWYFGSKLGWEYLTEKGVESYEIPGLFGNLFNQSALPILVEKVKLALEKVQENQK
ncbi:non-ribosomal peptide synthetase [Aerosakkonema funiforme]|uniref:non-ribosomal peptide synthetase n=1 Tax=Aerosakkonema funiforme TaxID=1246630 RepID=UPI0035BA8BB0